MVGSGCNQRLLFIIILIDIFFSNQRFYLKFFTNLFISNVGHIICKFSTKIYFFKFTSRSNYYLIFFYKMSILHFNQNVCTLYSTKYKLVHIVLYNIKYTTEISIISSNR